MNGTKLKVLLIDVDDERRDSRVKLLNGAGYEVDVRKDFISAERLDDEDSYDIVILALHQLPAKAIEYSDHLHEKTPRLPILLLTDFGVFIPRGTLNKNLEAGNPTLLIKEIAAMLVGSSHVREIMAGMIPRS
jgi:response regulator RpfG family c-di-GMP phosphodiesterase